jgi:hypothetical protein
MDDSGFSKDVRQTTGLSGSHVQQSKVFRTMTGARGPYNLGGSTTLLPRVTPLVLRACLAPELRTEQKLLQRVTRI